MPHIASRKSEVARIARKRAKRSASIAARFCWPKYRASSRCSSAVVEAVVRSEIGEVEERRVEARIIPIDQPEPLAVIDEIPGEKVVVAKGDVDRADEPLEPRGRSHEACQLRDEAAFAFAQRRRIVAQDVERPEHQEGAAQMLDHLRVAKADQLDDALECLFLADGLRREHLALDESDDERARLRDAPLAATAPPHGPRARPRAH